MHDGWRTACFTLPRVRWQGWPPRQATWCYNGVVQDRIESMPTVSVLLPVHNAVRYLPTALESVTRQAGVDFDVVVVDDGSTDGSAETAERIAESAKRSDSDAMRHAPCAMRVYRLPYNLGVTEALRFGLDRCESKYVARQDADDVSFGDRLRFQVAFLEANPQVAAVGTRVWILDEAGVPVRHGARLRWLPRAQMLIGRNPFVHGSVTFRRDLAERVGGYLSCFEAAQDLSLWLRMGRYGRLAVMPWTLYGLRAHPGRISVSRRKMQRGYAGLARWAHFAGGGAA